MIEAESRKTYVAPRAVEPERVVVAAARLAEDPTVRLAVALSAVDAGEFALPLADAMLATRCAVLVSAARALAGETSAGGLQMVSLACHDGNVVLGVHAEGAALLVVAAPGANLGLTMTRVRAALGLDGPTELQFGRPSR